MKWLAKVSAAGLVLGLAGEGHAAGAPAKVGPAPRTVLDACESTAGWTALPADGVEMKLSTDVGLRGRALRVDFQFTKGGGYAVLQRKLALDLPPHYRFTWAVRGATGPQNLEFKLIDASGENVWWCNRRDFAFPSDWTTIATKKRQVVFAWGPLGGGELRHAAAVEFAITAGSGGSGTVWLDELAIEPLEPPPATWPKPIATASSAARGSSAALAADGDTASVWRSAAFGDAAPTWSLDLGAARELSGVVIDWAGSAPASYVLEGTDDRYHWRVLQHVRGSDGGRDPLWLREEEVLALRIRADRAPLALREVSVRGLDWAPTVDRFSEAIAREAPRGSYPRGLIGEQVYWAVVGVDGSPNEALLGEDGAIEVGRAGWSVEPFLRDTQGRLLSWADFQGRQTLEQGFLPLPSVHWLRGADTLLVVSAVATGTRERSSLNVRYRLPAGGRNRTLYLVIRPFQVNPPAQFLNTPGGVAEIAHIAREGHVVRVNGNRRVILRTEPDQFGCRSFAEGDVVQSLGSGALPRAQQVEDPFRHASAVLAFDVRRSSAAGAEVAIEIPLEESADSAVTNDATDVAGEAARWRERLTPVTITLPDSQVVNALYAQLGWVLVNRDGAAIQPGSRSYERSWIRDGSLTSTALLRMGLTEPVREFLEWFAPRQFANGKVPCCVDRRGSDPVPEHDSHGQFIYLVAEYLRLTGDVALPTRLWPNLRAAAAYLDTLRSQRLGPPWVGTEFHGILPPSISHEGYSAKPMHSYWDDFWAVRGYRDAVWLAEQLGHADDARVLRASRDAFEREFRASIAAAQRRHGITYVPGCADLGDFDATSTTMALSPLQAAALAPPGAIDSTFERYWEFFSRRRDGREPYDAYTPYELRNVGAMVHLGWRDRAYEALLWFMRDLRPAGWLQWAEVVDREPRHPRFIGDMPHTWVGTDFVRSVLDMLAYEREADSTLVLAAGVPRAWVRHADGVRVRGLRTRWGALDYSVVPLEGGYGARIGGALRVPPGGIVLRPPGVTPAWTARVEGRRVRIGATGDVTVRAVPARIELVPPRSRRR